MVLREIVRGITIAIVKSFQFAGATQPTSAGFSFAGHRLIKNLG